MDFEEQVKEIAQSVYDSNSSTGQFTVSNNPFHFHTGNDSPNVSFLDLHERFMILPYTLFGTQSATAGNYSAFFTAPVAMTVASITEVHAVKGTDGSAVSLQVEKLTGTTAPGSGTTLLSTAFDLKGTINTVQTTSLVGTIKPTTSLVTSIVSLQLSAGDRLALKLTGTPTAVANVTVTLILTF